jgi:hypothetical protein
MEQRPLRLGDIVDDYCPRERRVTNHVVVALLGESVKQTRCSTCDAEHLFKHARVPARKKKDDIAALETAVLASVNGTQLVARIDPVQPPAATASSEPVTNGASGSDGSTGALSEAGASETERQVDDPLPGGWMGHRTLIRASLPKTEGELPPPRPIPEFTMHQRQTRGSQGFRGGQGWNRGPRGNFANGNGNGCGGGHSHGNGPAGERNGNVGGGGSNFGSGFSHGQGGNPQGNGNGQGRPPGQGRHHRHGKHRRPR